MHDGTFILRPTGYKPPTRQGAPNGGRRAVIERGLRDVGGPADPRSAQHAAVRLEYFMHRSPAEECALMPRVARMFASARPCAGILMDHGGMHGGDLAGMPGHVRRAARDCGNGEIEWPLPLAGAAVSALAAAGRVIAGLDIWDYDAEGRFAEVVWSALEPGISASLPHAVESTRAAAMTALDRAFEHHSWNDPWVVVTW